MFSRTIIFLIFLQLCLINAGRKRRVVGGEYVPLGEYPIVVSIRENFGEHVCGGAIIDDKFVLTAAHCVENHIYFNYSIHLDNLIPSDHNSLEFHPEYTLHVDKIIIHPKYRDDRDDHDIALLKLYGDVNWLHSFYADVLPLSNFGLTGDCSVFGYGATKMNSVIPYSPLKYGLVKIISLEDCRDLMGEALSTNNDNGILCALGHDNDDACQGDSGSPLICDRVLEGIVSYGTGCGITSMPGVYTRVAFYMDWIESVINGNQTSQ